MQRRLGVFMICDLQVHQDYDKIKQLKKNNSQRNQKKYSELISLLSNIYSIVLRFKLTLTQQITYLNFKFIAHYINMILFILFSFWLLISFFALYSVQKILKKYSSVREVEYPEQWKAFVRQDFGKWNSKKIIFGCFFKFPFKILLLLWIVVGIIVVVLLTQKFKKGRNIQNIFAVYLARPFLRGIIDIKENFEERPICTPLVISNHVNWFDLFYLQVFYYPISFVSKAEVEKIPLMGFIAKFIQCIFLNRKDQAAREIVLSKITERVNLYKNQKENGAPVNPLIIYPEGTTSNGRSIMRFKQGAFNDLADITLFGFKYQCQQFEMGMEEISQGEHLMLSLCQSPKLEVQKKIISALPNESPDDYMNRAQLELSKITGFPIYNVGFTEKDKFKNLRAGSTSEKIKSV